MNNSKTILTMRNRQNFASGRRQQQGMAVLVMCLILLLSVSMLLLNSGKTSVMEQLISANEYRAKEVAQAAEAGLDWGAAWAAGTAPDWSNIGVPTQCYGKDEGGLFDESAIPTDTPTPVTAVSGNIYKLDIIYCRNSANRKVFRIVSTATSQLDGSVAKTLRVYSTPVSSVFSPFFSGAPLIVDGCVSNTAGTPQVHPYAVGDVVYETSQSFAQADAHLPKCTRAGFNEKLNLNGGVTQNSAFTTGYVWEYVFSQTRQQIRDLADAEVAAGIPVANRNFFYYSNYPFTTYHESHGTAKHPVVIVFDNTSGCPKLNGGVVIYGVVFIDSICPSTSGWGNTDIYGSLVVNGDADHLTANTNFYNWRIQSSLVGPRFPQDSAPRLIGTWIDF